MTNLRHHIWRVESPFWSRSRRIECALMRAPPGGLEASREENKRRGY